MRGGPLSHAKVVELLNAHFVPVYTANEDYRDGGAAPADERAALRRIQQEGYRKKLSVGTVHVYVLSPDGDLVDSRHVAQAAKPLELIALLQAAVERFGTPAGGPVVTPKPQSRPPACGPDCLTLHLVARTTKGGAGWGGPPGEDWVVFDRAALAKLLPAGPVAAGVTWEPDSAVLARLLTHFYPETENNDVAKNRIEEQTVRATVVSVTGGVVRARLDGRLRMKHPFYHKDDDRVVRADLLGYIEFEAAAPRVRALRLVTTKATYGPGEFAVAVREVR